MNGVNRQSEQEPVVGPDDDRFERGHRPFLILFLVGITGIFTGIMPIAWKYATNTGLLISYAAAIFAWMAFVKSSRPLSLVSTLLIAASFRLLVFTRHPNLSGDVFRYLWDGRLLLDGLNPYAYTPDDPGLIALRQAWHALINHPEIATIYPPLAQVFFALAAISGGTLLSWRFVLLAVDLTTIVTLRRIDARASLAWATSPLVVLEGFWSGHVEIVSVLFLVSAWSFLRQRRSAWSGAFAAAATGVKVVPLFAAPPMILEARNRFRWIMGFAAALAIPMVPFALLGRLMPGMRDYATRWSFNSPLYEGVRRIMIGLSISDRLESIWTAIKDPLHAEAVSDLIYRQLYPEMVTRAVLGIAIVAAVAIVVMRLRTLEGAIAWSLAAALLLSPTIHPWYWLTPLPFAVAARERLIVLFAVFSPVSYLLYTEHPPRFFVFLGCYALPLAVELVLRHPRGLSSRHD